MPITVVLTDTYSDWEIAALSGVGRAFYGAEMLFASPEGGPLESVAGLQIASTERFEAPREGVVVVCGGPAFEGRNAPDITDRLAHAFRDGCIVAGICSGTTALARAGLIDDVPHTSNGPGYIEKHVPSYRGGEHY